MKKTLLYALILLPLAASCAKVKTSGTNDAAKAYFDAWAIRNGCDSWSQSPLGSWIIEDKEGSGAQVQEDTALSPFIYVEYSTYTLEGGLTAGTGAQTAKQLGVYQENGYYGPSIWRRGENTLYAGVDEAVTGMKVGGRRKFAMPGWLATYQRYTSVSKYLSEVTGSSVIYDVELKEIITSIHQWEADSVWHYVHRRWPEKEFTDSVVTGMYYIRKKAPINSVAFTADSTYYINYVGRCLDGRVFDTNIRDTAMYYGIWSSTRSYAPSGVKWASKEADLKLGGSTVISGFSKMLWQMGRYEAGTAVFRSALGYSSTGSGTAIPPYSPLRFDVEFVDNN